MQVEVRYRPAYALAIVTLDDKEKIQVEGGAMVGMSPDIAWIIAHTPSSST